MRSSGRAGDTGSRPFARRRAHVRSRCVSPLRSRSDRSHGRCAVPRSTTARPSSTSDDERVGVELARGHRSLAQPRHHVPASLPEAPCERSLVRTSLVGEWTARRAPTTERTLAAPWVSRSAQHRADVHQREQPVATAQRATDLDHRTLGFRRGRAGRRGPAPPPGVRSRRPRVRRRRRLPRPPHRRCSDRHPATRSGRRAIRRPSMMTDASQSRRARRG